MSPKVAPYGTWESPITADFFVDGGVNFTGIIVNEQNGKIYLHETRPDGRGVIVEISETGSKDVLPQEYNNQTHVHEYGGAHFCSRDSDGHLIFSDFISNIVFNLDPETQKATPIVHEDVNNYFADFNVHPVVSRWVIAIKEDHHSAKVEDIETTLVAIDSATRDVYTIASGADFYQYPRFSPDGSKVCWMQWYHPNMPWHHTELWVGDWKDGKIENPRAIVKQEDKESISQPKWSPDGSLFFISDRSGFWQLYHQTDDNVQHVQLNGLESVEFAVTEWFLGSAMWTLLTADTLVAFPNQNAYALGIVVDVKTGEWHKLDLPFAEVADQAVQRVSDTSFVVIAVGAKSPKALYLVDINAPADYKILKSSSSIDIPSSYFSQPKPIIFPRKYGHGGGEAYGLYLPPTNPDYSGPSGKLPPLIVAMHGGPTFCVFGSLSMRDQYWTSRGYALVEVNYVGSSGFGKQYRSLLDRQWGVSDIADAASVVDYLADQELIDKNHVGITGHSAGGYATLMAICSPYRDVFTAAVGESAISEMKRLTEEIHKFESHYLYSLCFGPDTTPAEKEQIYKERSPMTMVDRIKAPLLMTTGMEDKIVPPNQAAMMAEMLRENGGEVRVCSYDGEGHILINGENIKDSILETEQWWKKYLLE